MSKGWKGVVDRIERIRVVERKGVEGIGEFLEEEKVLMGDV